MKLQNTKYLIFYALLLTVCISIYAQNINVRGRVVGKYDGEPLVSVIVKAIFANGKDSIVDWTDADGKFTASVPENQLLRFQDVWWKDTIAIAKENLIIEMEDGKIPCGLSMTQ